MYAVELAFYTGMRIGELTGLKWSNIREDLGCILIQYSEKLDRKEKRYYIAKTKTGKERLFPLTDDIKRILNEVKKQELKNQLSHTLITKILMGTLGCVPAYDKYFIAGIKSQKVAAGNYSISSVMQLAEFYENNTERLESIRENMKVNDMAYPQMKVLDMGFWQVGFYLDKQI